ncbi:OmpA family protein [Pontivivens ytuae]|uniref:OmpA family protein n=1 Tax=Pontivivens ytuae TaxID=2789856 RepID=A0A7S9QDA8_9RHOB|nr:OmpA family protein [Pontivivens ytuae]QPH55098.1 OmpA family protein [Pontivivens ytuae]
MKSVTTALIGASAVLGACAHVQEAPPPPPPPPAVEAPAATEYTVFFGFDRADLTDLGQQTVSEAASAAMAGGATSVSVVGHTDTSGSVEYNQGLSEARASTVVGAMVADGVNPAIITASGRSENDLAVPTEDGVREPRNRRVEIGLSN